MCRYRQTKISSLRYAVHWQQRPSPLPSPSRSTHGCGAQRRTGSRCKSHGPCRSATAPSPNAGGRSARCHATGQSAHARHWQSRARSKSPTASLQRLTCRTRTSSSSCLRPRMCASDSTDRRVLKRRRLGLPVRRPGCDPSNAKHGRVTYPSAPAFCAHRHGPP
jgi:hypothetical protein